MIYRPFDFGYVVRACRLPAIGSVILFCALIAGCSSNFAGGTNSPAGPTVPPTAGSETDGQLSYLWHQDYTSSGSTPSRYTISVNSGWQPKEISATSIAKYIADDADDSFGDDAPITLTITCRGGQSLATGTYTRNIGGSVDVTWRSYNESDSGC